MRKILRGHVFNKNILFTLCLGLSFLGEAHAQVSGTFTINSAVATGGSNFQTFSAAVAFLAGGVNGPVTFNVQTGSGPYNEQVVINTIAGTSATNTITFNCNGVTLSFLSTDYSQRAGVKLNGADYITFDNLNVTPQADQGGEYGYGFHLLNDADHNTVKNCHITNAVDWDYTDDHEGIVINGNDGISYDAGVSYCDDNLIQNNTITGGSVGVTLNSNYSNGGVPMSGNKIIGNSISNNLYYGIQVYNTTGTVIDGNDITGGADAIYGNTGIYLDYFNYGFSVVNNKIHGLHSIDQSNIWVMYIGAEGAAGQTSLIANNLIYDIQTDGSVYGISAFRSMSPNYAASYINIYNNTISLDDQAVTGRNTYGLYFEAVTDVNVMNNIVTISRSASQRNVGIYFSQLPANFASQRNVIYVADGPLSTDAIGYYGSRTYSTMDAWQKATGFDYYSTSVNPVYTNLAGFDFRPTTQSIDNLAAFLNILKDIDGAIRNTTNPDVGCYEFTSPACSSTITGGTINVLPDSILCSGPKISLGLAGNSAGGGQTYTWQSSASATSGFANITSPLGFPYLETIPTTSLYYRVALTCGATTVYSNPKRIIVNSTLTGGSYTINNAQPTGNGNFNSFSDAALALKCGIAGPIVFNAAPGSGPYNEQLIIPEIATTAVNTVTFNGNGVKITYQPTVAASSAVVKLNGADYVTIDSLNVEVQGSSTFGMGIQMRNNADHNVIKRCKVDLNRNSTGLLYSGIAISTSDSDPSDWIGNNYCDSNLIANNTITGGYYGISLVSNSLTVGFSECIRNVVRKNIIKDNQGFGIYISGLAYALIDSNDISQPTRTVFDPIYTGISVFQNNYGLTITRNKIHNLGENVKTNNVAFDGLKCEFVQAPAGDPIVFTNNLLYTWRGGGLQRGMVNVSSDNLRFYHNTISFDDSTSVGTGETHGFTSSGALTVAVEVKDNLFYIRRGGNADKYGIYTNLNDSGLVANYNNYYISSTTPNTAFVGFMTKDYVTLTDWQATRKDANSVSINPVFEDMAKGDYTPTKILLENKGSNVGIINDILNNGRNTASPDMGAIEFTICRMLTSPVLSVEEASINTIKYKWTPVTGTSGYRVSRDGINWTFPSSGAMGTSHTVVGLKPMDTVKLIVKALGSRVDCPEYLSQGVVAQAQTDQVFIPNMFSPNNNGTDDYFKVYSTVMKTMHLMVFNQWGVKVFETNDPAGTWDGNYKGKPQPVGVYVYIVTGALFDGTKVNQKGSLNLIR